mmetsp:Transcript_17200/g.37001  ORF Transcript_17200/g.37001 Transcript_17200/m.37001 type:complete len:252 (+) Transcript_17200:90-845(+)|eukprot:CAMPEP_0206481112 /NCGR_PEP_ID=MMETSP0324_2-20121206/37915_1 /ASSEMBLY_ACC=CAM_ASM_000836 /TAXON_ID=2866 /ORGANISM="Crypthecodinium cohnii, Strain Seligo" /LENGTH=251 /DNA_ID=CAMNT_0053958467 /DNA_START=90 /DNA_END=845 /DNA_ORIENTATION=+
MGCGNSKKAPAAVAAPQTPSQAAPPPAAAQPEGNAAAAPAAAPSKEQSLKVLVHGAYGLRPADLIGNKSDVYVEVSLVGKPESKATTKVVSGKAEVNAEAAADGKVEKPAVNVELEHVLHLPGYVDGDKVLFVVKDKDGMKSDDYLGEATVSDPHWGGQLALEKTGSGFTNAHLMVQLGSGGGLSAALELKKTAAETARKLKDAALLAASGDPIAIGQAARQAGAALGDAKERVDDIFVEIKEEGPVCCTC